MFRQEYPATPDEAFISTGRPVFNPDYVTERINNSEDTHQADGRRNGSAQRAPSRANCLCITSSTRKRRTSSALTLAWVCATVTPRSAQVLDTQAAAGCRVAWPGASRLLRDILVALGYYYNTALIAPERNNHGLLTCVRLRDADYPMIYTDQTEGTLDDKDTINIGFFTSERTKPLIIDKLRAVEREA
jgi:hypothetical protein